jgi:hypothetical protein
MKRNFVSLCLLGVLMCLFPSAANAGAKFSGSFNVSFYGEPSLGHLSTWCFDFTTTGGVLGFPNSGTWNVPSYDFGWSGEWYQNGDEVIFHGVADGTFIFSWKGRLLTGHKASGRFTEFFIDGKTDFAGTFAAAKVPGNCPVISRSKNDPLGK